ncbi:hypothetical protein QR680_005291 [Steinernema hermaphroditum]|uniref:Protein kinase domain-containing protein n=1 Tax=Steinernema hermaphroditum TaxID=289476 RepID=A0AA39HTS9_9BILA|nr:hypothetical protein QR680_005291 [Steinernema hermaphroditum]
MEEQIREYEAFQLPEKTAVKLKMANLRLHSTGVFSNVYRGTLIGPGPAREIALKKTWPESAGSHKNLELLMLMRITREHHKNIIEVLFTFQTSGPDNRICESMVFAFIPATLAVLIKDIGPPQLNLTDVKVYTWQLFNGLYYLSKRRIVHRDIKPQNLLIEPVTGVLKIGDFGSAKIIKPNMESTAYQVTRFYRPPELLFEATHYSTTVDVWSAGCVVGEMIRGSVLFPGSCPKDQLTRIMNTIGSPDEEEVYAMKAPVRLQGERIRPLGFRRLLPHAPPECVQFVQRILVYRPKYRLCGKELLLDSFFHDILVPGKRRENGRLISLIITSEDIQLLK